MKKVIQNNTNIHLFELKKIQTDFPKVKICSSKDAYEFIKRFYSDDLEIFESFFILLTNRSNLTMGYAKISQGGMTGTVVDPILILKYAVDSLSKGVFIAHNHPSGNSQPSQADIDLTKKVKEALKFIDVSLLDSLIITADNYFSFSDEGLN